MAKSNPPSGCHTFVVSFVMPVLSVVVAAGALYNGAMLVIECERLAPRRTEEVLEERGVVTVPVERVIEEGRVDAHITRKVLGVFPVSRVHLTDVTQVDSTSSSTEVTDSSGRRTSSYNSGHLDLTTRAGHRWSSPEISHAIGHAAEEMEARIQGVLESKDLQRVKVWSIGWLANIIGVPFTLVALLLLWRSVAKLFGRAAGSAAR